jgi:hypothetical protein
VDRRVQSKGYTQVPHVGCGVASANICARLVELGGEAVSCHCKMETLESVLTPPFCAANVLTADIFLYCYT